MQKIVPLPWQIFSFAVCAFALVLQNAEGKESKSPENVFSGGEFELMEQLEGCPDGDWSWTRLGGKIRLIVGSGFSVSGFDGADVHPIFRPEESCQIVTFSRVVGKELHQTVRAACALGQVSETRHFLAINPRLNRREILISWWEGQDFSHLRKVKETQCRYKLKSPVK